MCERLLAFDPGKSTVGWAAFKEGILIRCGLLQGASRSELNSELFWWFNGTVKFDLRVVVEIPQIYQQRKWKGDPNDLIDVTLTAGAITCLFWRARVECVTPREWKGTVPKKKRLDEYVVHQRNLEALDNGEASAYDEGLRRVLKNLRHNIADAVGIGLWVIENG